MNHPQVDDAPPSTPPSAVGWRQRAHRDDIGIGPTVRTAASTPFRFDPDAAGRGIVQGAALLLTVILLLLISRLPWNGDLGIHAATIESLRGDLLAPGSPQVDADSDSPYYSPWTVLLSILAQVTGVETFTVMRFAAVVSVSTLLTGIWHFSRTLGAPRRTAPLALVCLLLLWGPPWFAWSGFLELASLAVAISYPSTFVVALSFHFWALLAKALRSAASWPAFGGLGLMWGVILLSHQYSGVVATLGALALLLGSRPWPARATLLRLAGGVTLGIVTLAVWPYYSFFSLFGFEGLEEIHRPLYDDLPVRVSLALVGVAALVERWCRDRRDPLVIFFALGTLMVSVGGLTGHWSWGRALPAVFIPAQLAAALALAKGVAGVGRKVYAAMAGVALLFGAWTQAGTLGYVLAWDALPKAVQEKSWPSWQGYEWLKPLGVQRGDTVMSSRGASLMLPAYGIHAVAPGFDDIFLPDQEQRKAAVDSYFAADTPRARRLDILHRYRARWVLQSHNEGGLPRNDPALRIAGFGPNGQVLYRVVG
ncbi:hypothetical protein ACWGH4_12450 [Streptomyces sp. NPDC054847]